MLKLENKKSIDKKEAKTIRIATAIADMNLGESINPTNLAHKIEIHPDTLRDVIDLHDSLKEVGFSTLRDKNGKVREILRTDESLNIRNEIRDLRRDVINIKEGLDEIKTFLKSKKK